MRAAKPSSHKAPERDTKHSTYITHSCSQPIEDAHSTRADVVSHCDPDCGNCKAHPSTDIAVVRSLVQLLC